MCTRLCFHFKKLALSWPTKWPVGFFLLLLPVAKKYLKEAVKHTFVVLLPIQMAARVTEVWPWGREVAAPKGRNSREVSPSGYQQQLSNRQGGTHGMGSAGHGLHQAHPRRVSLALERALLATPFGSAWTWEVPCFAIPAHRVEIRCLDK